MSRTTFSGPVASTNGFIPTSFVAIDVTPAAAITVAQLTTGKITSTSAAAVAITLPTDLDILSPFPSTTKPWDKIDS